MIKLVLIRHGESTWNKENRFTGWTDVDLTEKGVKEAIEAGEILEKKGFKFDLAFTSVLKRAIKTLWLALEKMDAIHTPITNSWKLNERHYGALQGLNKAETLKKYGEEKFTQWRRSYATPPPALKKTDKRFPGKDARYKDLKAKELPLTECLKDTVKRVVPFFKKTIVPLLKKDKQILVVAHGNSLRALVKHLDGISDKEIANLNIPTGIPLVYELNKKMKPIRHYYLGDAKRIKEATEKVAKQGKSK